MRILGMLACCAQLYCAGRLCVAGYHHQSQAAAHWTILGFLFLALSLACLFGAHRSQR